MLPALGGAAVVAVLVLGLLGRVANALNLENPVPLRWSDAFFSGNSQVAAVGLNPVLFLYDTLKVEPSRLRRSARCVSITRWWPTTWASATATPRS